MSINGTLAENLLPSYHAIDPLLRIRTNFFWFIHRPRAPRTLFKIKPIPLMKNPLTAQFTFGAALFAVIVGSVFGQSSSTPSASDDDSATVSLSPFEVTADNDSRYYGSNSIGATRTRTELRNLPMSMQVLTNELIEDTAAHELIDVVTYASGVSEGVPGTSGTKDDDDNTGFTLRGTAGYLPMRNGFRRLRLAPTANIQQVEILKGPASLLYGQLAPGGTVNYITKRPVAERSFGSLSLSFGNYDMLGSVLDYNHAVVPGKFAVRVVGSVRDIDPIEERYHQTVTLLNPTLSWWITPKTKFTADFEISERNADAPVGNIPWNDTSYLLDNPGAVDRTFNTRAFSDSLNTSVETIAGELSHEFSDHFSARVMVQQSIWEADRFYNSTSSFLNSTTGSIGNRSLRYQKHGSVDDFAAAELVNRFTLGDVKVQNMIGVQRQHLQFRNRFTGSNAPGVSNPSLRWNINDPSTWIVTAFTEADTVENTRVTGTRSTNLNKSLYLTNQLTFLDGRFHTLAGVRFEELTTELDQPGTGTYRKTESPGASVPQVGALFRVSDKVAVYSSYSESFNPAFSTLRNETGDFFVPEPETGEGFDLGVKVDWDEPNLSFTAAVFTLDRANILRALTPVTDPLDPNTTFTPWRQSGSETSEGFEFDFRWAPSESAQLIFSYGYTDAYVSSDEQNPEANEGHGVANAPRNTFALFYRQELDGFAFFKKTYFTFGARAISSRAPRPTWNLVSPGVYEAPPRMPGYELFDFGVGGTVQVGERDYDLRLNVKNAFDKLYLAHRFAFGNPRIIEFSMRTKF